MSARLPEASRIREGKIKKGGVKPGPPTSPRPDPPKSLKSVPKPPLNRIVRENDAGPYCSICRSSLYKKHWWSKKGPGCIQPKCMNYLDSWQHKAVEFLQSYFDESIKDRIRYVIKEDPEKWWWARSHFDWGMVIRNALRKNGFSEEELGIENLGDHYVLLIEEAVQ